LHANEFGVLRKEIGENFNAKKEVEDKRNETKPLKKVENSGVCERFIKLHGDEIILSLKYEFMSQ